MAKYSSADLLKDEMNWIGSKDFIGKMINRINKSSTVLLTIQVPKNVFLRAAVLCDDIQELSELQFEQNDLINLLFNDFLLYAKKHPDPGALFSLLSSLEHSGKIKRLQQQDQSVFKMIHQEPHQEKVEMHLRMRRKVALRGEILLADLEEVQPNHGYTLERIFELLYIDFIDKFRKGNSANSVDKILSLLDQ